LKGQLNGIYSEGTEDDVGRIDQCGSHTVGIVDSLQVHQATGGMCRDECTVSRMLLRGDGQRILAQPS
jgi:hypothetical protein